MSTTWKTQVPTYDQLTLPLLQLAADGRVHTLRSAGDAIADTLNLTESQRGDLLPSGRRTRFADRLTWAKTYLVQAGLLKRVGWGQFQITQQGLDVLKRRPSVVNRSFLNQFPAFRAAQMRSAPQVTADELTAFDGDLTPHEVMEAAYLGIQQDLANDLLDIILAESPEFFERLVIDLLLAMGYGGSRKDAAQALGRSGDGGIDGLIREDRLGLDMIYVQAKRWARDKAVGRPDVQGFVGSLIGEGGKKGVFITTSRFTSGAMAYADGVTETKVILIDGARLTQLMLEHGVGVVTEKVYSVQMIDMAYFKDDR